MCVCTTVYDTYSDLMKVYNYKFGPECIKGFKN